MKFRIVALICAFACSSPTAFAEPTVARKVESYDVQGADGSIVVRGVGLWGIYCGGAAVHSVYFDKTLVPGGYNALLASVLSAYALGKSIRFYGDCMPSKGPGWYMGTYLIVSDN